MFAIIQRTGEEGGVSKKQWVHVIAVGGLKLPTPGDDGGRGGEGQLPGVPRDGGMGNTGFSFLAHPFIISVLKMPALLSDGEDRRGPMGCFPGVNQ